MNGGLERGADLPAHDAHVERMTREAKELNIRIQAAVSFVEHNPVFMTLGSADQELLKAQAMAMQTYFQILCLRIERATD